MTIPDPLLQTSPGASLRTAEVAAWLAAKMCHDLISPASAILSGLDLLEDPSAQDMREDAMGLISSSARKLTDLLSFCRVAFGASASAEMFDVRELQRLTAGIFQHMRADLDWQVVVPSLSKPAARAVLNLGQLAGAVLPMGGRVRIESQSHDGAQMILAQAMGPRARLRPEVLAGLTGEPLAEGLHGSWIQAYYTHLFVRDAGGQVHVETGDEKIIFVARLPVSA